MPKAASAGQLFEFEIELRVPGPDDDASTVPAAPPFGVLPSQQGTAYRSAARNQDRFGFARGKCS
jgi:hypothetical protein